MVWLVIFVALMIPLTAVVLDSPVVRAWVDRRHGGDVDSPNVGIRDLAEKVGVLEAELEVVNRQVAQLQEEQQFLQRLIEDPANRQVVPKSLPKPGS
ncbi:MAG: hypothetical protein Q8Q85_02380 [Gemmatimonadales bacterium]|nr:hypothetical protein [Gemmatimonadales bacterium]